MNSKQTDFPELEGALVLFKDEMGYKGVVKIVGCNYDIGITMVVANDIKFSDTSIVKKGFKICCINGPSSRYFNPFTKYYDLFYYAVECIKNGFYDATEAVMISEDPPWQGIDCKLSPCPYSGE